jgi:adenylyltransferase/sulfurtransferase
MSDALPTALDIPRELLLAAFSEARTAYPSESCGWMWGDADGSAVDEIRPCENVQALGGHPTVAGRPPETAYVFKDEDLLELARSIDTGRPAKLIYHSHPNGMAYLSETDRTVATSPWGDGPSYPVQQLVVGIDGEAVREAALYAWSDDEAAFVEIARYDGADV